MNAASKNDIGTVPTAALRSRYPDGPIPGRTKADSQKKMS